MRRRSQALSPTARQQARGGDMNDTLDQRRAKHILDALDGNVTSIFHGDSPRQKKREEQKAKNKKFLGEFTGAAKSFPAAILINGFGMAIATMIAQRRDR